MSALGTFIEFVKAEEKGMSVTNDDLMHGKVLSLGGSVSYASLKVGDKIIVSTVKKVQDMIDGEIHYWVDEKQVVHKF